MFEGFMSLNEIYQVKNSLLFINDQVQHTNSSTSMLLTHYFLTYFYSSNNYPKIESHTDNASLSISKRENHCKSLQLDTQLANVVVTYIASLWFVTLAAITHSVSAFTLHNSRPLFPHHCSLIYSQPNACFHTVIELWSLLFVLLIPLVMFDRKGWLESSSLD